MREDLLQFVWKQRKLPSKPLLTSKGKSLFIKNPGQQNFLAGPDFFNARIDIDAQLWAGNVEVHINSSDWYAHGHENDSNYDNVILHVVWQDDASIFRKDGSEIPTLEIKDYISKDFLNRYQELLENPKTHFINCEKDFQHIEDIVLENWLERLFFERLEQKSKMLSELLDASHNDWEKVLFCLLMKNFGLKVNGSSFLEIAKGIDFSIIRKLQSNGQQLETLLLGMAGLLNEEGSDTHYLNLKEEYDYLRHKYNLPQIYQKPQFYGLRPNNFPTIRLSQIAQLYRRHKSLFQRLIEAKTLEEYYALFAVETSPYWQDHYTFGKISKKSKKKLTQNFIDLLLINTVVPIKFGYSRYLGKNVEDELIGLMTKIKREKNVLIEEFNQIGKLTKNALQSQAKIQLYNEYCTQNRCLQCQVGAQLLNDNN